MEEFCILDHVNDTVSSHRNYNQLEILELSKCLLLFFDTYMNVFKAFQAQFHLGFGV
jgi:hypothetical protein